LIITAFLFKNGTLTATTQTIAWCIIFFFASAGASAAYLTVSEIFPMETRAMAIAFFYAFGTALGGISGPILFGALIASGHTTDVFYGYLLGAALMIGAGIVEVFLGVEAAGRDLEDIAAPLSAQQAEAERGEEADALTVGGGGEARTGAEGRAVGPEVINRGDVERGSAERGGWHRPGERSMLEV
jgi:MFS family permease